jgi:hypothetical protein
MYRLEEEGRVEQINGREAQTVTLLNSTGLAPASSQPLVRYNDVIKLR